MPLPSPIEKAALSLRGFGTEALPQPLVLIVLGFPTLQCSLQDVSTGKLLTLCLTQGESFVLT